jgi:hypothetical protein
MANLRIAELDFDEIKANLKAFLNNQSEFSDYDFEGSGLSVLIDLLAYNTHYNAYLANMLVNEMFLDSAVKRSSAVSLSKHLGYTPRSARGARARLTIDVLNPTGSPSTLNLPIYSPFTTNINGTSYTFLTTREYTTSPTNNTYTFSDVDVFEGQAFEFSFVSANPGPGELFQIPNQNIDTSTITVTVQESATNVSTTVYTLADDIAGLDGTSTVYFLQESAQERFEIYFGDGVIGKKLTAGNIIRVQYIATNGEACNVSSTIQQNFTSGTAIGGSSNISITTESNSTGGAGKEDITSLKFYAPKFYASQNRAVTVSDYATLIQQNFTQAESINVWGGEENNPPAYGRVFISLKPTNGYIITDTDKNFIINTVLADRTMLTVEPIFVDPEFVYVNFDVEIKYNPLTTTTTRAGVEAAVKQAISDFFDQNLQRFNSKFYYSQLQAAILAANPSILSCVIEITLNQRISPSLNTSNNFDLKFANKLHPATLQSTSFFVTVAGSTVTARLRDVPVDMPPNYSGTGDIQLYNSTTGTTIQNVGTVNYATGEVTISTITPIGYPAGASDIKVYTELQKSSYDITVGKNQLLVLDESAENFFTSAIEGVRVNLVSVA